MCTSHDDTQSASATLSSDLGSSPISLFPTLHPPKKPRIFASNLKERMAQRFYNLVLLPRVRDDIAEYKRLNFHLYMALKKALFKPGAWFKGGNPGGC